MSCLGKIATRKSLRLEKANLENSLNPSRRASNCLLDIQVNEIPSSSPKTSEIPRPKSPLSNDSATDISQVQSTCQELLESGLERPESDYGSDTSGILSHTKSEEQNFFAGDGLSDLNNIRHTADGQLGAADIVQSSGCSDDGSNPETPEVASPAKEPIEYTVIVEENNSSQINISVSGAAECQSSGPLLSVSMQNPGDCPKAPPSSKLEDGNSPMQEDRRFSAASSIMPQSSDEIDDPKSETGPDDSSEESQVISNSTQDADVDSSENSSIVNRAVEESTERGVHQPLAPHGLTQQPTSSQAEITEEEQHSIDITDPLQCPGLDEGVQNLGTSVESKEVSRKITRSNVRLSDDTNMLKDFLSRAQARKAARSSHNSVSENRQLPSPRRSPRKALAELNRNSPSTEKPYGLSNRPGTPPGLCKLADGETDETDELSTEPVSYRRSARTRLPIARITPPGAPSFIPLRRPDGAEHVVLQKSIAQELATVTRSNTRRNKGQSKPPNLTLQGLISEGEIVDVIKGKSVQGAKSVGWDDKLVYFEESLQDDQCKDVPRVKVRKLRGLGAANGTPAPKKTAADKSHPNGTTAPKRRGKSRGQM